MFFDLQGEMIKYSFTVGNYHLLLKEKILFLCIVRPEDYGHHA